MKVFISLADRSASNYVYHIFKDIKGLDLWGIVDERLLSIGIKGNWRVEDFSVVGFWEALWKVPKVFKFFREFEDLIDRVDVLILCDAPALNIPLLKKAKGRAKKIIYFISPQVWAWKEERARIISELSDHLIVILPFEVDFYKRYSRDGFNVHYVGHPLVDIAKPSLDEERVKAFLGFERYLCLMPGSRWSEVKRHAPYLRKVYEYLLKTFDLSAAIPTFEPFLDYLKDVFKGLPVRIVSPKDMEQPSYNILAHSEFSIVASGTAELEASLLLNPHAVFYRVNPISFFIAKRLVKVRNIALTNLILSSQIVPEVVQKDYRELAYVCEEILKDDGIRKRMKEDFLRLRQVLGPEGTLDRLRSLFVSLLEEV